MQICWGLLTLNHQRKPLEAAVTELREGGGEEEEERWNDTSTKALRQ